MTPKNTSDLKIYPLKIVLAPLSVYVRSVPPGLYDVEIPSSGEIWLDKITLSEIYFVDYNILSKNKVKILISESIMGILGGGWV